jgi:hypothetical protein
MGAALLSLDADGPELPHPVELRDGVEQPAEWEVLGKATAFFATEGEGRERCSG